MTETDLAEIETRCGFRLPAAYRATLLDYPFPAGSLADEFMLLNRPGDVIELNEAGVDLPEIGRPFFVGSDGGEEWYCIDAALPDSPVFIYEVEAGRHRRLVDSWPAYLDHIRAADADVLADQRDSEQRKRTKRWWEFWK